jgi:hypothetical protein
MTTALYRSLAAGALALAPVAQPASAAIIIDFKDTGCQFGGTFCTIPGNYGDTARVDVSYASINNVTGARTQGLNWYGKGYGDLEDVVWGGFNERNFTAEIRIEAAPGFELSLIDFDFATFANIARSAPFSITDLAGNIVSAGVHFTGWPTHSNLAVNSAFGSGMIIRWGPDSYNVGVDNIRYEVRSLAAVVPEPSSWAMMIIGFGLAGAGLRRRSLASAFATM